MKIKPIFGYLLGNFSTPKLPLMGIMLILIIIKNMKRENFQRNVDQMEQKKRIHWGGGKMVAGKWPEQVTGIIIININMNHLK